MSTEISVHAAQTAILRELLFHPSAGYAQLQKPTKLSSDHFNFHISRLVELGFVEKIARGSYKLTVKGKEYANRLDTDNNTVERQPKVAVMIGLERIRNGEIQYIFQQRRKNPFFGFWGLPTGKIRWGETIAETARRESLEETGLDADFAVIGIYHEHVISAETGVFLEDKIFFMVKGTNPHGALMADFEGGHNEWMSIAEALKQPKKYETLAFETNILQSKTWFNEKAITYSKQDF